MTRRHLPALLALLVGAAACSDSSQTPGARLLAPGPLAVFEGIIAHGDGTQRPYLAIGNQRGDELRLLDLTDYELVVSPGLAFPLSVPTEGQTMLVASAHLGPASATYPDALAVVSAGSTAVELVDTWTGFPTVVSTVDLDPSKTGMQILSMIGAPLPDGAGGVVADKARLLVSIAGGKLAVIELARNTTTTPDEITASAPVFLTMSFDAVSLSTTPMSTGYVWAASHDRIPDAGGVFGVAKIALPNDLTGWTAVASVTALDALAPTELVAAAKLNPWVFPSPGVPQDDAWLPTAERVVTVPVQDACGPGKAVRCGLIALDPLAVPGAGRGNIPPNPVAGEEPYLLPIDVPGPITALAVASRWDDTTPGANLIPLTTTYGTVYTSALATIAAANGRVYMADLARWKLGSDTSPVEGTGLTRVSAAATDSATSTGGVRIALWPLAAPALPELPEPSTRTADLKARVRVTPGFTPDDDWTLTYQGILPGLDTRGAVLGRDGTGPWLAVQIDIGAAAPAAVADLLALDVRSGDLVEIGGGASPCPAGTTVEVDSIVAIAGAPGGAARLRGVGGGALPACLATAPTVGTTVTDVATFRASELVLVGEATGYAGRLSATDTFAADQSFTGARLFYVTDGCLAGSTCATNWKGGGIYDLSFPYPTGPKVGLAPVYVTETFNPVTTTPTTAKPAQGAKLTFTTKSGLTASGRRPVVDSTEVASQLPSGIVVKDDGVNLEGAAVHTSYTAGLIMIFNTGQVPSKQAVIR